ncbi:MAG: sensor histidine kinase [Planctomycetota bacterium]
MTSLSIRWRLAIFFSSAVAVIVLVFGVILIFVTHRQLLTRTDLSLREELREMQLESQLHRSAEEFQLACQTRFFHHDIYEFVAVADENRVIFASARIRAEDYSAIIGLPVKTSPSCVTLATSQQETLRAISASTTSPFGPLRILALTSLRPMLSEIRTLETVALVLLPAAFLVAIAVGYFLAGRALSPVTAICDVANSVTINHLDRRITVTNPHDELGVLAETVNGLIRRLEQAVREIQRFTADASHEIRTPLAALKLEAELALRTDRSPEDYRAALQVINAEAGQLCRLADQLLMLSREDAGVIQRTRHCVAIHELLEDLQLQLQPIADSRDITLQTQISSPCETIGDEVRLRQLFFNLLENALKFTNAGGRVRISCASTGTHIHCSIHDTGSGIPDEHLPHIFRRFYRADPARSCSPGGTGLGLAIALRIVETHNGSINVRSQLNVGTEFTVSLPASGGRSESPGSTPGQTFTPRSRVF